MPCFSFFTKVWLPPFPLIFCLFFLQLLSFLLLPDLLQIILFFSHHPTPHFNFFFKKIKIYSTNCQRISRFRIIISFLEGWSRSCGNQPLSATCSKNIGNISRSLKNRTMATQPAKLLLPVGSNNSYQQALSIPLHEFQLFADDHLAWLRHVAYTIYGREGHISLSPNGTEIDADAEIGREKYYYVSRGEPYFVVQGRLSSSISSESALLLDPELMDDRTSVATADSTSWGDFRQRVTDRDGTCVLDGGEENLIVISFLMQRLAWCVLNLPLDSLRVLMLGQVHETFKSKFWTHL